MQTVVAVSEFYLNGLLHCCDVPMWPVTRTTYQGVTRRYRCGECGRGVDALSAEVEVWELATGALPELGHRHTPYPARGGRLLDLVARVNRDGDEYVLELSWNSRR